VLKTEEPLCNFTNYESLRKTVQLLIGRPFRISQLIGFISLGLASFNLWHLLVTDNNYIDSSIVRKCRDVDVNGPSF